MNKKDYADRKQARIDSYRDKAQKNRAKSYDAYDASKKATEGIPTGQPILIGHHSEGRHRAAIRRSDAAMRKSIEATDKANYYDGKANAAENNTAISSDDPEAIEKLQAKLDSAEKKQALMKGVNRIVRNKKLTHDAKIQKIMNDFALDQKNAENVFVPDCFGGIGFAKFQLQNNNANIRRMKQRIEMLQNRSQDSTSELAFPGGKIVDNVEENRLQIIHDDKPDAETRANLKSAGFRWSRYNNAWQRHRSNYAIDQAKRICGV